MTGDSELQDMGDVDYAEMARVMVESLSDIPDGMATLVLWMPCGGIDAHEIDLSVEATLSAFSSAGTELPLGWASVSVIFCADIHDDEGTLCHMVRFGCGVRSDSEVGRVQPYSYKHMLRMAIVDTLNRCPICRGKYNG